MPATSSILQQRIDQLEQLISNTHDDLNKKILELKFELNDLRQQLNNETAAESESAAGPDALVAYNPHTPSAFVSPAPAEETESINAGNTASIQSTSTGWNENSSKPIISAQSIVFVRQFFLTIFYFMLNHLSLFISPIQALAHRSKHLYQHYKDHGKAPVFLMTVAGLITLTVGFGYLLQYSFNTLFNDTLKALTGFLLGIIIIISGSLLARKKPDYSEYAASVIALGVIFNYLSAYFIGPYFNIISDSSSLILLCVITLASFLLALLFETRVVAITTLVGGVFMPFIFADVNSTGLVFIAYLFILSSANLYLSNKIQWPALGKFTFILSLSVLEYIGIRDNASAVLSLILLSAFLYLYVYYWSFKGSRLKQQITRYDITFLLSNSFYFIYAVLHTEHSQSLIASIFILHALLLSAFVLLFRIIHSTLAAAYLLMISVLIACSVFVLAPLNLSALIWALEGLVLVFIGFHYPHKLLRAEGYAIYFIAMLSLLSHLLINYDYSSFSAQQGSEAWLNLSAFGFLSLLAYRLIAYFKSATEKAEQTAGFIINETFSLWGAVFLSLLFTLYTADLAPVLTVIPLAWCFYRAAKFRLRLAQLIGFYYLFVLALYVLYQMFSARSSIISEQSTLTQIALFELVFFSWGLHLYYQYFALTGRAQNLAKKIHQLTFYLPVIIICSSLINIFFNLSNQKTMSFDALWFDFIISAALLLLAYLSANKSSAFIRQQQSSSAHYITQESVSLFISAFFLYSTAILFSEWMYNAAAIPLLYLLHRSLKYKLPLTELLAWFHFAFFFVISWLQYKSVGNLHFSEQALSTQIVWLELLLCSWLMRLIYERTDKQARLYQLAVHLRTSVYLLIPLLMLPRIIRLYPQYLAATLWLSFTISWLMHKKLKINALQHQLSILYMTAILSSILVSLNALTGDPELPGLIAIVAGAFVISLFNYSEKALTAVSRQYTNYLSIQQSSPYFYGFAVAALSYSLTGQLNLAIFLSAVFFLYLSQERRLLIIMKRSLILSYSLAWMGLCIVPVIIFLQAKLSFTDIVVNLLSLLALWFLSHQPRAVFRLLQRNGFSQVIQLWLFHIMAFCVYSAILNTSFEAWSVGTSLAMLMHAVVVLFLTLQTKYKALLRLSISLYALTAIKLLFHDMTDFNHIHKVIALMGIGSILMLAAFIFQRARNNRNLEITDAV
ncbi:MAG: DUF2339 domain-containing protein [Gammaproteobacteria bacterium]|nr:DUF2339 domain-containing protein [Gammaproteobacteria bacterium]